MERFGAVGDDLQAMVRGACGDLDRDRGEEDWAFSVEAAVELNSRYHHTQ